MNQIAPIAASTNLPTLTAAAGERPPVVFS
jgi:hypothetical protein